MLRVESAGKTSGKLNRGLLKLPGYVLPKPASLGYQAYRCQNQEQKKSEGKKDAH